MRAEGDGRQQGVAGQGAILRDAGAPVPVVVFPPKGRCPFVMVAVLHAPLTPDGSGDPQGLRIYAVEIYALSLVISDKRENLLLSIFSHSATSRMCEPLSLSYPPPSPPATRCDAPR